MSFLLCSVYKSRKREGMYLYVDKVVGLTKVPAALLEIFGTPVHAMDMPLKAGRDLAQITGGKLRSGPNPS